MIQRESKKTISLELLAFSEGIIGDVSDVVFVEADVVGVINEEVHGKSKSALACEVEVFFCGGVQRCVGNEQEVPIAMGLVSAACSGAEEDDLR
jgi:hypothetical protein